MALQFKCIDTMKLSRDNSSLSASQIQDRVNQYAGLGLTHLTVDCFLNGSFHDDTDRENWVTAVRNIGLKVWWRPGYDPLAATPETLKTLLMAFPTRRPDLFQNGDIFDMLPEQSPFMSDGEGGFIFGPEDVPTLVAAWNPWVRDVKTSLDTLFASNNLSGVITGITSITDFNAKNYVTPATYAVFGYACMDDYPTDNIKDPIRAARNVVNSLIALHDHAGVDVVVGEYGHHRSDNADQSLQREILRNVWNEVSRLPWVVGYNYWCGHGGAGFGDFCNLLESVNSVWVPRAALKTIGDYYTKGAPTSRMEVI
jgi:hypothetical protein